MPLDTLAHHRQLEGWLRGPRKKGDVFEKYNAVWDEAGRSRTRWVALQGIGAPFGVGFVAAVAYFANVRKQLIHHEREMELVAAGSLEPATV